MSQPLPTGRFKWTDVSPNEISKLATRTDKGYVLEVDISGIRTKTPWTKTPLAKNPPDKSPPDKTYEHKIYFT